MTNTNGTNGHKPLTRKQEAIALNVFQGMPHRKAYAEAGYSLNLSQNALDVEACRIISSPKVALRIAELRQVVARAPVMDVVERSKRLSEIGREDIYGKYGKPVRSGNISAIAELNRMQGSYAPEKHEHTGPDGGPIEHDHRHLLQGRINSIIERRGEGRLPQDTH